LDALAVDVDFDLSPKGLISGGVIEKSFYKLSWTSNFSTT
jgi:hypothetical protein